MVISTLIGTFFGALLGLRFKVVIVAPAILIAVAIVAVSGAVHGDGIMWIALTALAVAASLQVGYIAGCTLRAIVAATHTNNDGVALPTRARAIKYS
jgi:hypothetical protein